MTPHKILKDFFGYDDFREGQIEIIEAILDGKNVLAVMPTGSGKSICFQIPALMKENFSLVISPLISLMQDQVEALNQIEKNSAFINSSLDYSDTQKVLQNIAQKKIKLLYVAPEKLANREFIDTISNLKPSYLFVDEAHCISQWGHNFRPSYRNIKDFADLAGIKRISAFTATATPEVRKDIIQQLDFKDPLLFVTGFERENISLNVIHTKKKKEEIYRIVKDNKGPVIIYTATRKNSEKLYDYLTLNNINAQFYHAGLTPELRRVIQDDFQKNEIDVIVATNAFGMGIDKKDISSVIHYNIPGTIESLYQEFGRAGRDGREASHYLFYSDKDKYIQEYLINLNYPDIEQIRNVYDSVLDYYRIAFNTRSTESLIVDEGLWKLLEINSITQSIFYVSLNILEQNGYLRLVNDKTNKSTFKFLLTKEKLKEYIKTLINKNIREFLLVLIQYYGSTPFAQNVSINFKEIQDLSGLSIDTIKENFERLYAIGIIELTQPNVKPSIEMMQERLQSSRLRLNIREIENLKNRAGDNLKTVIKYCFLDTCRFRFILNYFGENKKEYRCNKCDNCRSKLTETASDEYINELIFRTFKEFNGGLTKSRLVGILSGKSKSRIAKSISTYASCLHYKGEDIEKSADSLTSKGLLKDLNGKLYFQPQNELLSSQDGGTVEDSEKYESNLELFNKLREERKTASKKFSQSIELICPDNTLRKITQQKPTTPSEFLSIEGVNQRMFNKIGLEFIELIKEHLQSSPKKMDGKVLPQHIDQTYKLVRKGYSLKEISNLLKLPESIVSIQIESIINYFPKDNYEKLIPVQNFDKILNALEEYKFDEKIVKTKLPNSTTYAEIRIVKAIFSNSRS